MKKRSKGLKFLKDVAEYYCFIFFINIMRLIGIDRASDLCGFIFKIIGPFSRKGWVVRNNLRYVYSNISDNKVKYLEKKIWENFGRYIGEFAFLYREVIQNSGRVEIKGLEILHELQNKKQNFIAFSGHFANWDFILYDVLQNTGGTGIVYRKLNNKYINDYVLRQRSYKDTIMIQKGPGSIKAIINVIKDKKNMMMLVDQKMNEGIRIPLLGKDANTPDGLALLARQFEYAILPAKIERIKGAHFRVTFQDYFFAKKDGNKEDDIRYTMIEVNNILSTWINENPGSWLWTHQRWGRPDEM